jgi:hypothetical protein
MQKELNQLEELVAEFDYLVNEGVIGSESERVQLARLAGSLSEITRSCDTTERTAKLKS